MTFDQLVAQWTNPPRARFGRAQTYPLPALQNVAIPWDTVSVDTDNVWDANNPTRITVPANTVLARAFGAIYLENRTDYARAVALVALNGTWFFGHQHTCIAGVPQGTANAWGPAYGTFTDWLAVKPGDYFELIVEQVNWANYPNTPDPSNVIGAGAATWLSVEFRKSF